MQALAGRTIVGVGQAKGSRFPRRRGDEGGAEEVKLNESNLPPHIHQVYRHAGMSVGSSRSNVPGAGGKDDNRDANVDQHNSGPGPGSSQPVNIMPPFYALLFCKKM
jgi:microcystin-dependent protein